MASKVFTAQKMRKASSKTTVLSATNRPDVESWIAEAMAMLRQAADTEEENSDLRRRLKVAEDALEAASDAFRFCIEQCELELGPRMIGKLCDDGKAVERALAAIREPVTDCNRLEGANNG